MKSSDSTKFYLSHYGAIRAIQTAEDLKATRFELNRTKSLVEIYRNQRDSSVLSSFILKNELVQEKKRNEDLFLKYKSANSEKWIWRGGFFITVGFLIVKVISQ